MVLFDEPTTKRCWITDRVEFMQTRNFPSNLPHNKRRSYWLQNSGYWLVEGILFKRKFDAVLLHCVDKQQVERILHEFTMAPWEVTFLPKTQL